MSDYDAPVEGTEPGIPAETSQADSVNPAWEPVLSQLPHEFHNKVTPEFTKWDNNYRELQDKYKAWEPYEKNNIQPDLINQALQFYHAANTDPQHFYEVLGQQLGISPAQAEQVVADSQDDTSSEFNFDPDDPYAQRLAEQQQMIDQMNERQSLIDETIQKEAYRLREQEEYDKIGSTLNSLQEKYGAFNTQRVLQLAQMQMNTTGTFDLEGAYGEYQAMIQEARNVPSRNEYAPPVLPASGGMPANPYKSFTDMDVDDRTAYFGARLAQSKQR